MHGSPAAVEPFMASLGARGGGGPKFLKNRLEIASFPYDLEYHLALRGGSAAYRIHEENHSVLLAPRELQLNGRIQRR